MSGRLREKEGLSAGKGAGNALTIGSADVNYTSYTEYGLWSMEYRDERKKKGMDIFTYMLFIIICGKRGRRAIYFNCRMAISSLLAWIRPI